VDERSDPQCNIERFACTSIYFLVPAYERGRMHILKSDELWYHLLGDPLTVVEIVTTNAPTISSGNGASTALGSSATAASAATGATTKLLCTVLGSDVCGSAQRLTHVVPAGRRFGCLYGAWDADGRDRMGHQSDPSSKPTAAATASTTPTPSSSPASSPPRFGFSLVGCVVTPGFDWHDFTMTSPHEVLALAKWTESQASLLEKVTSIDPIGSAASSKQTASRTLN